MGRESSVAREVPVLEVEDVSVAYSGRTILDAVSFEVRAGEFTGLIGSNGVGKTTLLRVVLGLQRPGSGGVRVLGAPRARAAERSGTSRRRSCWIRTCPSRARPRRPRHRRAPLRGRATLEAPTRAGRPDASRR